MTAPQSGCPTGLSMLPVHMTRCMRQLICTRGMSCIVAYIFSVTRARAAMVHVGKLTHVADRRGDVQGGVVGRNDRMRASCAMCMGHAQTFCQHKCNDWRTYLGGTMVWLCAPCAHHVRCASYFLEGILSAGDVS